MNPEVVDEVVAVLPEGFGPLEPFVAEWAIEGTAARAARRDASTAAERAAFFATAGPLLEGALQHLDATPLADHDPAQRRLMQLVLSFAHVALAEEIQRDGEAAHARFRPRMPITRSTADVAPAGA